MTIFLDCMSPCSSSVLRRNATYRKARRAAVSPSLPKGMFWSCFRWGLHSLPCYQGSGGLLHRHSTLTGIPRRFLFCCTGLGVTPTGRYPAPCPVKPGLSSPAPFRKCGSDHLSYSEINRINYIISGRYDASGGFIRAAFCGERRNRMRWYDDIIPCPPPTVQL